MKATNQPSFIHLEEPARCCLWQKASLTMNDVSMDRFETVSLIVETNHACRKILQCKECGQLYFYEFIEETNFGDEDDIFTTFIPVRMEDALELENRSPLELLAVTPRIQWDSRGPIKWVGKSKPGNLQRNSGQPHATSDTPEDKSITSEYVRNSEGRIFNLAPMANNRPPRVLMAMGWMNFQGFPEEMGKSFRCLTNTEVAVLPPDNPDESTEEFLKCLLGYFSDSMGFARLKDGRIVFIEPLTREEWARVLDRDDRWKIFEGGLADLMDSKPLSAEEVRVVLEKYFHVNEGN